MSKNLVIVESPAKAKTISKYLGKDFDVLASYGHVRDLVPKEGAVDPDSGFAMKYQVIERNEKHVNGIVRALKKADALYLATDPDREGEAISWHLIELLKEKECAERQACTSRGLPRNYQACRTRRDRSPRRHFQRSRRRSTGAPRARLSRRFQLVAALMEEVGPTNCLPVACKARRSG